MGRTEAGLDYARVKRYWDRARPSILGPYMMDGFGFPAGAGRFRFREEARIVRRLIHETNRDGAVLDLGCGVGCWTEYFAKQYRSVVAIEGSEPLYEVTKQRCASYPTVKAIHGDVLAFTPEGRYALVFVGGMLMYLNESDVMDLLRKVMPLLEPGGIILCRESTVRKGILTRQGNYQVVYRSVETYRKIFTECGVASIQMEKNVPYLLMQMGCELIRKWKAFAPKWCGAIPVAGRLVYWGLRLGNPWITRLPGEFGRAFPELTNHFFVLRTR